jgi:cell division topological specificity factor
MSCSLSFSATSRRPPQIAKERLQLIIAHERNGQTSSAGLPARPAKELIAVISKYVSVNARRHQGHRLKSKATTRCLEVNIVAPCRRCRDTEANAIFAWSAMVDLNGQTLKGCAWQR